MQNQTRRTSSAFRTAIFSAILSLSPVVALADFVVDTGTPPATANPGGAILGGFFDGTTIANQSLAGKFTLTDTTTITSLEGYIGSYSAGDLITIAIETSGSSNLPDAVLFSGSFSGLAYRNDTGGVWEGLYDLNFTLSAGDYWLVFSTPTYPYKSFMSSNAPSPLEDYAAAYDGVWRDTPLLGAAMRINVGSAPDTDPYHIPDAGQSGILLGFGILTLALRRRR